MKHRLLLMGGGGHCGVILDHLLQEKEYQVVGILDVNESLGKEVLGVPVVGTDKDLPKLFKQGIKHCFISAGSVGNPAIRIKLHDLALRAGYQFPNVIHPSALISPRASLGQGIYVAPYAVINVNAVIGDQCIINTGAIIEHDCAIGDFVHVASGVVLSGGVKVGNFSHIGTGAQVIQYLHIGAKTVVGAGSVVTKNIRQGVVAWGNPCKERRYA